MPFGLKKQGWMLLAAVLWQAIVNYLIATGVLQDWVAWINFGIVSAGILVLPKIDALKLFILSIPFYVVLQNPYFETLSMWRPLVAVLFVNIACRFFCSYIMADKSAWTSLWRVRPAIYEILQKIRLCKWEKFALVLFFWAAVTLLWTEYPGEGLKQIFFIANAALAYPVTVWTLKKYNSHFFTFVEKWELWEEGGGILVSARSRQIIKATAISCGIIILIGFGQLIATLFVDLYFFWQFWADNIASLYYGQSLAGVLTYSNSWLGAGLNSLRMFSIMPSSHAFAMVCVLFIGFLIAWFARSEKGYPLQQRVTLYSTLALAALAIVLSGTRGVWVGAVPVAVLALYLWRYQFNQKKDADILVLDRSRAVGQLSGMRVNKVLKLFFLTTVMMIVFVVISPGINYGLNAIRSGIRGDSFSRAISIIDFSEASNAGRLEIWKKSLSFALRHPFGVGFDNFISTLNNENIPIEKFENERNTNYNLPQKYITAHSLYLQILVELGIVGLVLFVLMWGYFFRDLFKAITDYGLRITDSSPNASSNPPDGAAGKLATIRLSLIPCLSSLSLVFLWFLAYSAFDLTWLNDKILLYTFVGLGIVRVVISERNRYGSKI